MDLRVSQKKQLRVLGRIASCGGLAALFAESVDQASDYEHEPREGFYPKARKPLEPSGSGLQRTKDVRSSSARIPVAFRPGPSVPGYRYVDRELRPFRTTGGATYMEPLVEGGPVRRAASTALLDLLLVDDAGQPAIAEVKIGRDQNRAFALVQGLMHAAALSAREQRRRLSHYMTPVDVSEVGPLDVLILEVDPPERAKHRAQFNKMAEDLATGLFDDPASTYLRSVRCFCYDSSNPEWKLQWSRPHV